MAETPTRKPRPFSKVQAELVVAPQVVTERPPAPDRRPPPAGYEAPGSRVSRFDPPDDTSRFLKQAVQKAEEARLDAEGKAAQLALELEQSKRRRDPVSEFDAVAYFSRFQVIALKILLPLAAVAAAVGVTLGIYSKTTIEPKVDRAADKQVEQATKTGTNESRLLALEKYVRAHADWSTCVNAQRDSAIERGTGHKVEVPHDDVQWVEQYAPKAAPRVLWKTAPWSISPDQVSCGDEPAPPVTPRTPGP
jgi:hypothetical protein